MAIRLGFQIPNFSYGTGVEKLFPTVIAQAQEAEAAGYDSLFVMDHFYQLPVIAPPDEPMLEAYTALGALATATQRLQLGTLVTGNTYRNPALLAKVITTLDVVSRRPGDPGYRAPAGSNSNMTSSDSSSARSPTGSTGSKRRCRSSCR